MSNYKLQQKFLICKYVVLHPNPLAPLCSLQVSRQTDPDPLWTTVLNSERSGLGSKSFPKEEIGRHSSTLTEHQGWSSTIHLVKLSASFALWMGAKRFLSTLNLAGLPSIVNSPHSGSPVFFLLSAFKAGLLRCARLPSPAYTTEFINRVSRAACLFPTAPFHHWDLPALLRPQTSPPWILGSNASHYLTSTSCVNSCLGIWRSL